MLYDQGTASCKEDFFVDIAGKVLGVLDTGSGVSIQSEEPQVFHGMTGGQMVGGIINQKFGAKLLMRKGAIEPIEELIWVNREIKRIFLYEGLNLNEPENNPFASYALAFFNGNTIEIIQGGDCQFVWQNRDGSLGWTENQTLIYDAENLATIATLMNKHSADRAAMWQEFGPILEKRRREYFNSPKGGFSLLNGQPSFNKNWQRMSLNTDNVEIMVGYTDGFVDQSATARMQALSPDILEICQEFGLQEWLNLTRKIAKRKENEAHISLPEATAIMIEF
jgi:hypothetical protein